MVILCTKAKPIVSQYYNGNIIYKESTNRNTVLKWLSYVERLN